MLDLSKYMTYEEFVGIHGVPSEILKLPPIPLSDGSDVSFQAWFADTFNGRYLCEPSSKAERWESSINGYIATMNTTISRMLTDWTKTLGLVTAPEKETLQLKAAPTAQELEDAYTTGGEVRTRDYRIDFTTADELARARAPFADLAAMFEEFFLPKLLTDTMEDV